MNLFRLFSVLSSVLEPLDEAGEGGVLGLDNVRLELPLAGVGSRTLAATIDHALLFLFQLIWLVGGALFLGLFLEVGGGWLVAILIFGFFLLQWGYFAALEILMGGQTPGKQLVRLRTVAYHGGRPTAAALLIRNLLRGLDLFLGLPLMVLDGRARRLGDFVAGTLVIHEQRQEVEEGRLVRHPAAWGAREVGVVESFLRRQRYLDRERARGMAQQLLTWLEGREPEFVAGVEPMIGDPVERLQQLFGSEA